MCPCFNASDFLDIGNLHDPVDMRQRYQPLVQRFHDFLNNQSAISNLQQVRRQWINPRSREPFGNDNYQARHWYSFNLGGRKECQFNIGLSPDYFRVGIGFEFSRKDHGDPTRMALFYSCFTNLIATRHKDRFEELLSEEELEMEFLNSSFQNFLVIPTGEVLNNIHNLPESPSWIFCGKLLRPDIDGEKLFSRTRLTQTMNSIFSKFMDLWRDTNSQGYQLL